MPSPLLSQVPIFRHLLPEHLDAVARQATEVKKLRGEPIILVGQRMLGVFVVATGSAGIYPKDHKTPVAILATGEAIGETILIHDQPATVSVRAEQDGTSFVLLPRRALEEAMKADLALTANLYRGISESLSTRLRAANQKMTHLVKEKGDNFLALPSPEQIIASANETLSIGRDGSRAGTSLATEIQAQLSQLAAQVPQPHAEAIKSVAYDVSLLCDRERACLGAFSTHVAAMRDFILKMMQTINASA